MHFEIGLTEFMTIMSGVVGIGWVLLKTLFGQFEHRINGKFATLDGLLLDVKRLELEQVRRDGTYAAQFVNRAELIMLQDKHDKVVERIFNLMNTINDKLDGKASKAECEEKMRQMQRDSK